MERVYKVLISRAAHALIEWEHATDFSEVAKSYKIAYEYTCQAIALFIRDKEEVFRDISRKVLELRAK